MATTAKLWEWNSDLESFVDATTVDAIAERNTSDGTPTNGCVRGYILNDRRGEGSVTFTRTCTPVDLGVDSDHAITDVKLTHYSKVSLFDTVDALNYKIELLDSSNTLITEFISRTETGTKSWTQYDSGTVDTTDFSSEDTIKIKITMDIDLGSSGSASADVLIDSMELTFTHEPSIPLTKYPTTNDSGWTNSSNAYVNNSTYLSIGLSTLIINKSTAFGKSIIS